jgi:prolyl 4-hydroxylase
MPLGPFPQPSFDCGPIEIEGRRIVPLLERRNPHLALLDGFLDRDECARLIEEARGDLRPSTVLSAEGQPGTREPGRTSETAWLEGARSPLVQRIIRRAAFVLCWPAANFEGLQVLRYTVGSEYRQHDDFFRATHDAVLRCGGQRVATLLMYLDTPPRGGATAFPRVHTHVRAHQGQALYFSYPVPDATSRTSHAGCPVIEGEKWAATLWLRQGPWRRPEPVVDRRPAQ